MLQRAAVLATLRTNSQPRRESGGASPIRRIDGDDGGVHRAKAWTEIDVTVRLGEAP